MEIQSYLETTLDLGENFDGKVGLTDIGFYEEKLELLFTTHFDDLGHEAKKF